MPREVIEKMHNPNVRKAIIMLYKTMLLFAYAVVVSVCLSQIAISSPNAKDKKQHTTATETTDELGNTVIHIKSRKKEGYTVHESNEVVKTTNEFYCEGYKVETLMMIRKDNHEVRSAELSFKINGKKIDLKPIIGSKTNLYGYANLKPQFSCVDNFIRLMIDGQPYIDDNNLGSSMNLIDILIDRTNNTIKSKTMRKKATID